MTQPSKFIFNTDYATSQNDAIKILTAVIPDSFTVPSPPFYIVDTYLKIGELAAGMRFVLKSSKYSDVLVNPVTFQIPATYYSQQLEESFDSLLTGNIIRSSAGQVRLRITPSLGYVFQVGDRFSNCGQTLTLSVQTFLSPFEK